MTAEQMKKAVLSAEPLLCFDNVTLRIGKDAVFEHTTWEIRTDEHWAIIGPNGGGKTTLIRALFRQCDPVSGSIRYYFDAEGTDRSADSRPYFYPDEIIRITPDAQHHLFGQRNGYHQARWQSFEGDDVPTVAELLRAARINAISPFQTDPSGPSGSGFSGRAMSDVAEKLAIDSIMERKVLYLSNGEARKVAIAHALLRSPKLLILDDPYCGLDVAARRILSGIIDELLKEPLPRILLLTHRPAEIPAGITHILHVANHRICYMGPKSGFSASAVTAGIVSDPAPLSNPDRFPAAAAEETVPTDGPLIEMSDVSISYGSKTILSHIDWTVRPGEHWAIQGPNGAGKSTLLSLILADNPQAYANRIRLFGLPRGSGESIWAIKQRIGWLSPELQNFYQKRATCLDVVCSGFFDTIGLYRACPPDQVETARQWMDSLDIAPLAGRSFLNISTGEKRLVLFARALVKSPRLLILDEPCQGLDAVHRSRLLAAIDRLCATTPVTLIYVSHHEDEMPAAITHILSLEGGRISSIRRCTP